MMKVIFSLVNFGDLSYFKTQWAIFDPPINPKTLAPYGATTKKFMDEYDLHEAIFHVWRLVDFANKMMDDEKPWALLKDNPEKGRAVLCNLLEVLRHISIMISPFIPEASTKIRRQIGLPNEIDSEKENGWGVVIGWQKLGEQEILFPRIEVE